MRRFFRRGLPLRLQLVAVLAIAILPTLAYAIHTARVAEEVARAQALERAGPMAEGVIQAHRRRMDEARAFLRGLAETDFLRSLQPSACIEILAGVVRRVPQYRSISVTDAPNGAECMARISDAGLPPQIARVSEPISRRGLPLGTLDAEITLPAPGELAAEGGLPRGGVLAYVEPSGAVVDSHPLGREALQALPDPKELASLLRRPRPTAALTGQDGIARSFALRPLLGTGLSALVGVETASEIARTSEGIRKSEALLIAGAVFGLLLAWLAIELLLVRWMAEISTALIYIGSGYFDHRPKPRWFRSRLEMVSTLIGFVGHRMKRREQGLRRALDERERLLREIHAGVAVNLRVIGSLLGFGTRTPSSARQPLVAAQARIHALELVHERALNDQGGARVELLPLLLEICDRLLALHEQTNARCDIDVPGLRVSVPSAVALSLIVTEAVMNALQHGFPRGRAGAVFLSLKGDDTEFHMVIADDGVGFDPEAEIAPASLGIRLMRAMAQQFGADLKVTSPRGGVIVLTFPRSRLD